MIVNAIKEIHTHLDSFVLVAPDPRAGRKHRYSVIRVIYQTGHAVVIGRELDLPLARIVAKRTTDMDGRPVKR